MYILVMLFLYQVDIVLCVNIDASQRVTKTHSIPSYQLKQKRLGATEVQKVTWSFWIPS